MSLASLVASRWMWPVGIPTRIDMVAYPNKLTHGENLGL